MVDRYVVIETVPGRAKAEFLRSCLNANGIHCEISQEAIGWIHGLGVGPLANAEILVPSQQAKRAREVMREYHRTKKVRSRE
jgi:hypothetical protein